MNGKESSRWKIPDPSDLSIRNPWVIAAIVFCIVGLIALVAKYTVGLPGGVVTIVLNILVSLYWGAIALYCLCEKRYLAAAIAVLLILLLVVF